MSSTRCALFRIHSPSLLLSFSFTLPFAFALTFTLSLAAFLLERHGGRVSLTLESKLVAS